MNIKLKILLIIFVLISILVSILLKIKLLETEILHLEEENIFTLPTGTGCNGLERLISMKKLSDNIHWLQWLLQLKPKLSYIKAGTYRLIPGMTVSDLLNLLVSGKEAQFSVRFVEGSKLKDWLYILDKAPYVIHTINYNNYKKLRKYLNIEDDSPLEGFFYPDTYLYTANTSDITILKHAYLRMQIILADTWKKTAKNLPYKNPKDLLIMASIVEKETGIKVELMKVASVFINRLRINMKLQSDSTVLYGMGEAYKGIITHKDIITPTPYNTYVISGLPPTPIATPSKDALQAASNPEKTSYFYFVADGYGRHIFTTNLENHNKAVQQYRTWENNRSNHDR